MTEPARTEEARRTGFEAMPWAQFLLDGPTGASPMRSRGKAWCFQAAFTPKRTPCRAHSTVPWMPLTPTLSRRERGRTKSPGFEDSITRIAGLKAVSQGMVARG